MPLLAVVINSSLARKRARIVNSRLPTFARAFRIRPILVDPADEQVDTGIDKNIRIFESRGEDGWRGATTGAAKKIDREGRGRNEIEAAIRRLERRGWLCPALGARWKRWWKNNARRRKDFSGWENFLLCLALS